MKTQNLQIKQIPEKSGVYKFYDDKNNLLYIGKAKNLNKRVKSYWAKTNNLSPSKKIMINKTVKIDYIITDTEKEAKLLELNLIKKHTPPFNVLLKDDKNWKYISIDYSKKYPEIFISNQNLQNKKTNIKHFGPFTSSNEAKKMINIIRKTFPLCLNPNNRKKTKCFNYHIGKCYGACVDEITPEKYIKVIKNIELFIDGRHSSIIKKLKTKMKKLAKETKFEMAKILRDEIQNIESLHQQQKIYIDTKEYSDFVSWYCEKNIICINIFKSREGKIYDAFKTIIKPDTDTLSSVSSFLNQYYLYIVPNTPKKIYTQEKIKENKIHFIVPKSPIRKNIIKMGVINAKDYLQKYTIDKTQSKQWDTVLENLKHKLNLKNYPLRIEGYDISQLQGQSKTGSMVVFTNKKPDKQMYRFFKIKTREKDDLSMMEEILSRRLKYIKEKSGRDPSFSKKPDLIVIDGGKAHLNIGIKIIKKYNLNIDVISIAKKEETIYTKHHSIKLERNNPVLKLIQQIRDESHRFSRILHHKLQNNLTKS